MHITSRGIKTISQGWTTQSWGREQRFKGGYSEIPRNKVSENPRNTTQALTQSAKQKRGGVDTQSNLYRLKA